MSVDKDGNKFKVNDTTKNVTVEKVNLKGKSFDKLSAAETKELTLMISKMLGLINEDGTIK